MMRVRWWFTAGVLLAASLMSGAADARPQGHVWRTLRLAGARKVVLETSWSGSSQGLAGQVALRSGEQVSTLARGGFFRTDMAVRDDTVLVAVASGGARGGVQLALVPIGEDGALGESQVVIPPPIGSPRGAPIAIIACPDPQGFTVLWQVQIGAATRDAETFSSGFLPRPRPARRISPIGATSRQSDGPRSRLRRHQRWRSSSTARAACRASRPAWPAAGSPSR